MRVLKAPNLPEGLVKVQLPRGLNCAKSIQLHPGARRKTNAQTDAKHVKNTNLMSNKDTEYPKVTLFTFSTNQDVGSRNFP